jgi:lysyl-tRNA synthetase class 2
VNGFHELTSADKQVERFEQDNDKRKMMGLIEKPIDKRFISALNSGLPDCSGVALGIDRLVMLAMGIYSIEEVISFPITRA